MRQLNVDASRARLVSIKIIVAKTNAKLVHKDSIPQVKVHLDVIVALKGKEVHKDHLCQRLFVTIAKRENIKTKLVKYCAKIVIRQGQV